MADDLPSDAPSTRLRGPWLRVAGLLAAAGIVLGPTGWVVTDALEQDDDFCNACHNHEGIPLHLEIRRDFDARPPASLASRHAAEPVRCIDCHGGVGWLGRSRVKLLAAKDAFWWGVGRFDEPTEMTHPLWDADCQRCHAQFAVKGDDLGAPAFHDLAVHNVRLGVDCVECHLSHEGGVAVGANFLQPAAVRRQCARCHSEFEDRDAASSRRFSEERPG